MIRVEVANRQSALAIDPERFESVATAILQAEGVRAADVSIVVVDDATMQQLNARYLQHDYPTDVLSFPLERSPTSLEGEIIVSAETATRESHRFGWTPAEEILLYLVHGTLHLIGYDDQTEEESRAMREKERTYLVRAGQDPSGVESRSN